MSGSVWSEWNEEETLVRNDGREEGHRGEMEGQRERKNRS